MNHTEAAQYIKATLTAFGPCEAISMTKETWAKIHEAMQALAQPEQEPVAWMYPDDYERMTTSETFCTVYSVEVGSATRGETTVALYTSPQPSKQWVGLTESEKHAALFDKEGMTLDYEDYAWAIEAKLREKNA